MRFDELSVGMSAEKSHTVTEQTIREFADLTGDYNPVHMDEEAARRSVFGGRIAHGMLSAGFISAVLGVQLPGPGAVYMTQSLRFTLPVKLGDTITARAEVTELLPEKSRVRLKTTCHNQSGDVVVEGEALLSMPRGPA